MWNPARLRKTPDNRSIIATALLAYEDSNGDIRRLRHVLEHGLGIPVRIDWRPDDVHLIRLARPGEASYLPLTRSPS